MLIFGLFVCGCSSNELKEVDKFGQPIFNIADMRTRINADFTYADFTNMMGGDFYGWESGAWYSQCTLGDGNILTFAFALEDRQLLYAKIKNPKGKYSETIYMRE